MLFLTVKLHVTYLKSFGAHRLLKAQQLFLPQSLSFEHLCYKNGNLNDEQRARFKAR